MILGTVVAAGSVLAADINNDSLDALIARIPQVARGLSNVAPEETALAEQIQRFGPEAVPKMVQLLSAKDDHVRFFAGYVLRGLDGIPESDLDMLIAAHKRGDGWIPPAIGRIGSPRAVAYLISDIRLHPETQTQVTWALKIAGKRAAIPLAQIFRDRDKIHRDLLAVIEQVFSDMGGDAAPAVPTLVEIAQDKSVRSENRRGAVLALGSIGSPAAGAVPALKTLAESEPGVFSKAVASAIVGIGTPDAVAVFLPILRSKPDEIVLRDLAALRENGRTAGPAVVALFNDPNWDVRVAAARTLGYIGYAEGTDELRKCLHNPDDWRAVYVAAESLGRLKAQSAVPELEAVARGHWFPAVRRCAQKAIGVIRGTDSFESRWAPGNFAFEYFAYWHAGESDEPEVNVHTEAVQPHFVAEPDALSSAELQKVPYEVEIVGYDEKGRHVTVETARPHCGLRCADGLLLGGDRGEWGGELAFRDGKGMTRVLLSQNVEGIHSMPFGILATCGLAHLTLNSGYLYIIGRMPDGAPYAKLWKVLPGAPERSGKLTNGDLFVACYGGNIVVSPEGEIRMAQDDRSADGPAHR